jgi:hypothetical protein
MNRILSGGIINLCDCDHSQRRAVIKRSLNATCG